MKTSFAATLAVVSILLLGACGTDGSALAPAASGTSGSSGEPVAEQQRETGLVAPVRPFGGDCANLLTDAEASGLLGAQVELVRGHVSEYAPNYAVELHAGLWCGWMSADFAALISVVVLPTGTVDYDASPECVAEDSELTTPFCEVEVAAHGSTASGALVAQGQTLAFVEEATASFVALFEKRAAANDPAPIPIPAVGAWANPTDCAAVVAAADLSAVPGLGAGAVGGDFPYGGHANTNAAEVALIGSATPFPYCWIDGESADVLFVASGGGRWLESTVTAGATPFAIEGYDSAYTSPGQDGLTKVDIFHGPNWLHLQVKFTKNAKPLADALFAGLATTAAE